MGTVSTRLYITTQIINNKLFQYCLGFQPSDGILFITETQELYTILAFLDARYAQILQTISNDELAQRFGKPTSVAVMLRDRSIKEILKEHVSDGTTIRIPDSLPFGLVASLQSLPNYNRETVEDTFSTQLRTIKTPDEITKINKAIEHTQALRKRIGNNLDSFIGETELSIRGKLFEKALSLGLSGEAFPAIVASGANSAIPHHTASESVIQAGPLLIDMGRVYKGYCSDMTRSYRVGPVTKENESLYKKRHESLLAVKNAHILGVSMSLSGQSIRDLCIKVRELLRKQRLEKYFTHALGHGIGLDVHEGPAVSIKSSATLQEGMVITIEPGAYFTGQFGIRWEDTIVVEK